MATARACIPQTCVRACVNVSVRYTCDVRASSAPYQSPMSVIVAYKKSFQAESSSSLSCTSKVQPKHRTCYSTVCSCGHGRSISSSCCCCCKDCSMELKPRTCHTSDVLDLITIQAVGQSRTTTRKCTERLNVYKPLIYTVLFDISRIFCFRYQRWFAIWHFHVTIPIAMQK